MIDDDLLDSRIRALLAQHGRLAQDARTLADAADLCRAGLSWHARGRAPRGAPLQHAA